MSHVPDSEKNRYLEMKAVGELIHMLFMHAQPTPAAIDAHVTHSLVLKTVADVFEGLHLAVRWMGRGDRTVSFDDIEIGPSPEANDALRVHVTNSGWKEGELRQLQHGLNVIGCEGQSVSYGGGGVAKMLIFTLPAAVVARLQGEHAG